MRMIFAALSAALLVGLAGCSEDKPAEPEKPAATEPATDTKAEGTAPATDSGAPADPGEAPADAAAAPASSSDVSQAAIDACLSAVDAETDGDVTVLSTEFSEANSLVMVGVGADKAPWKCLVGNDGKGTELTFAGDDGDGPGQPAAVEQAPAASSDVSQAALDACLSAVDAETDGDVAVLSSEFSEANSLVMVGVGADKAPWKCLVSNDGTGAEISFAGDEGAL
ncbi:MAG: hypothetical protein KDK07_08895 [Bauldia sp.]|nr:hypothetical protein [Bauldia sp.]